MPPVRRRGTALNHFLLPSFRRGALQQPNGWSSRNPFGPSKQATGSTLKPGLRRKEGVISVAMSHSPACSMSQLLRLGADRLLTPTEVTHVACTVQFDRFIHPAASIRGPHAYASTRMAAGLGRTRNPRPGSDSRHAWRRCGWIQPAVLVARRALARRAVADTSPLAAADWSLAIRRTRIPLTESSSAAIAYPLSTFAGAPTRTRLVAGAPSGASQSNPRLSSFSCAAGEGRPPPAGIPAACATCGRDDRPGLALRPLLFSRVSPGACAPCGAGTHA